MRTASPDRNRPSTSDAALARLRSLLGPDDVGPPSTSDTAISPVTGRLGRVIAQRRNRVVERWVPAGLRGARTDPGRRGAAVLVMVALAGALAAAALAWQGRPQAESVAAPPVLTAAAPGAPSAPSATSTSLIVAVTGRVRNPGVVTVSAGARVIDALKAAGGPLPGADLALLNLARKVADGELVVVGMPADGPGDAAAGASGAAPVGAGTPIDLNAATLADLDTLPGVGPVLAQRILDWRTEHGRFANIDQLGDVPGIGESRLAQLRELVRV